MELILSFKKEAVKPGRPAPPLIGYTHVAQTTFQIKNSSYHKKKGGHGREFACGRMHSAFAQSSFSFSALSFDNGHE